MFKHSREAMRKVNEYVKHDSALEAGYAEAKEIIKNFRRPAFYELSTRCNLKCEGCYYFEGGETQRPNVSDIKTWERFFESEAKRGVSIGYFVGAEPALEQDRLLAAAPYFPYGNVGTNGTIALDPAIPYRIGVSIWAGEDETDQKLRGASVFRKALKTFRGDPRAIMIFTVSGWTVNQVEAVAEMCADHDVDLTFNLYSPTQSFLEKLAAGAQHDNDFFRVSSTGDSPTLDAESLQKVRKQLDRAIEKYPKTVLYNRKYNEWICGEGSRYSLDPETGIALDCHARIQGPLRYYTADLQPARIKCCTSSMDCSQCRVYSAGWSSRFVPRPEDVVTREALREWIEMMKMLSRIFLYPAADHMSAAKEAHRRVPTSDGVV